MNTIYESLAAELACRSLARGTYQAELVAGRRAWSGADLAGAAKSKWWGAYARSRENLLAKMAARLGYPVALRATQPHGKLVAIVGRDAEATAQKHGMVLR